MNKPSSSQGRYQSPTTSVQENEEDYDDADPQEVVSHRPIVIRQQLHRPSSVVKSACTSGGSKATKVTNKSPDHKADDGGHTGYSKQNSDVDEDDFPDQRRNIIQERLFRYRKFF